MIEKEIKAKLQLPFDFCNDCLLREETYSAWRNYSTGNPCDVTFTCVHTEACYHAVKMTKEEATNGKST